MEATTSNFFKSRYFSFFLTFSNSKVPSHSELSRMVLEAFEENYPTVVEAQLFLYLDIAVKEKDLYIMEALLHIGERRLLPGDCYLSEERIYSYENVQSFDPNLLQHSLAKKLGDAVSVVSSGLKRRTFTYLWPEQQGGSDDPVDEENATWIWISVQKDDQKNKEMRRVRCVPL